MFPIFFPLEKPTFLFHLKCVVYGTQTLHRHAVSLLFVGCGNFSFNYSYKFHYILV